MCCLGEDWLDSVGEPSGVRGELPALPLRGEECALLLGEEVGLAVMGEPLFLGGVWELPLPPRLGVVLSLDAEEPGEGGGVGKRRSGDRVVVSSVTKRSILGTPSGEELPCRFVASSRCRCGPERDRGSWSSLPSSLMS